MSQLQPIVGAKFRPPAAGLLQLLPVGTRLLVRREPQNEYDANALQVILPVDGELTDLALEATDKWDEVLGGYGYSVVAICSEPEWHLGYVPKEYARELAPQFDAAGAREVPARLAVSATGLPRVQFEVPGGC